MRSIDYTPRDRHIVDYSLFTLPDVPDLQFRGPAPTLEPGEYVTCLGAAQALGVLIDRPYPTQLAEALARPVLNLGLGGVSASFLANEDALLAHANRGASVVLQIVAARAEPNDRFQPTAGIELVRDLQVGDHITTIEAWMRAFKDERFSEYVEQSRASWLAAYHRILDAIDVPVVLFWFAPRSPSVALDLAGASGLEVLAAFPQFVDGALVDEIAPRCSSVVVCESDRNFRFPYIDRNTGEPTAIDWGMLGDGPSGNLETENRYYPSNEMNEDAIPDLVDALAAAGVTRRDD